MISASDATATAIISRPSSVWPIENTFTRGEAFSSIRMYLYTRSECGRMPGAPAMSPSTDSGVGTVFDAGKYSVSGELKNGSVVYFLIFALYASSMATFASRIGRTGGTEPVGAATNVATARRNSKVKRVRIVRAQRLYQKIGACPPRVSSIATTEDSPSAALPQSKTASSIDAWLICSFWM